MASSLLPKLQSRQPSACKKIHTFFFLHRRKNIFEMTKQKESEKVNLPQTLKVVRTKFQSIRHECLFNFTVNLIQCKILNLA